jgi:hypothetical protein
MTRGHREMRNFPDNQRDGMSHTALDQDSCFERCDAERQARFDECMERAREYRREHLEGDGSGSLVHHSIMVENCTSPPHECSEKCGSLGR